MKNIREKQLEIALLKEKIERISGQKVLFKENLEVVEPEVKNKNIIISGNQLTYKGDIEKEQYLDLKQNYSDYIINVEGDVNLEELGIEVLGLQFGRVTGFFNCSGCVSLKSLNGSPKKVGKYFDCSFCDSLTSLEGSPEEVGYWFNCSWCDLLVSLKGVSDNIHGGFDCSGCKSLETLENAPKHVGSYFTCFGCKKQFGVDEVLDNSNVGGKIVVK